MARFDGENVVNIRDFTAVYQEVDSVGDDVVVGSFSVGSSGVGAEMSDHISIKDYVDAQDDRTRAINDAAMARIEGKLDSLSGEIRAMNGIVGGHIDGLAGRIDGLTGRLDGMEKSLSHVPTLRGIIITGVSIAIGALGVAFAGLSFGSSTFGLGLSVSPEIARLQAAQEKTDRAQDAKLDLILEAIAALKAQK